MMRKSLVAFACVFGVSNLSLANSTYIPPTASAANLNPTVTLFDYPDPASVLTTGVVFYYTPDLVDYFDNDITKLTDFINDSVNMNNLVFANSGIGLRRQVAGVFETSDEYVDANTYAFDDNVASALILAKGAGELTQDKFSNSRAFELHAPQMEALGASNTTVLQRRYEAPEGSDVNHDWVGLAYRPGVFSIVTPYDNRGHSVTILSHELGHNDGLRHQRTESDEGSPATSFASECDGNYSVMYSGGVDYEDFFISDANHVHSTTSLPCGEIGVSDSAQYYKDKIEDGSFLRYASAPNNFGSVALDVKGSVSVLLSETSFSETSSIEGEVIWSGLSQDDTASITIVVADYMDTDVSDFDGAPIITLLYDGNNSSKFSFKLTDDQDVEAIEKVSLMAVYPNGVSVNEGSAVVVASVTSDDLPIVSFSVAEITVVEGEDATMAVVRENGTDGELTVTFVVEAVSSGTAEDISYPQSVTFEDGDASVVLVISAPQDTLVEGVETVGLRLNGDSLEFGATPLVTITIDDRVLGTLALDQSVLTVNEGGEVVVTINRLEGKDGVLNGTLSIAGGTASSSDYSISRTSFAIPDGETSTTITIKANADTPQEQDETVLFRLASSETTIEGPNEVVITIKDTSPATSVNGKDDSGGGSMSIYMLPLGLFAVFIRRRRKN